MTLVDNDLAQVSRLIEALRPSLDRVVIVGGWVHRLYRYRTEARPPKYSPLFTNETDIAILVT